MLKRALDFFSAVLLLVILSPILLILWALVSVKLGKPALFRQSRPGKDGKLFTLVKFRTMTAETDAHGDLLPDSQRLTRFGRFLRSTSLDELPELWNVIRGDMSFVGPRPLLEAYISLYSPTQGRRHEVRPGITGLAQVKGRNALSWQEKFGLDVWYVDNRTFRLDMAILWWTVASVFRREGVSAEGSATMPPFTGND